MLLGVDEEVLGEGEGLGEDAGGLEHLPTDLLGCGVEAVEGLGDDIM